MAIKPFNIRGCLICLTNLHEFKTKEIDSIEKLKEIYFRRTKQHIKDMTKIHIEYIEVEEKVY